MTARPAVWVLEDDEICREVVCDALAEKFDITSFDTVASLESALGSAPPGGEPSLVVADVCLPDQNFVSWLAGEGARGLFADVPFLVMSSLDEVETIRRAFGGGAVDFLSKPFGRASLQVKVERILAARAAIAASAPLFELDPHALQLRRPEGTMIELTTKELGILSLLDAAPGRTMTRDELRKSLWRGHNVGKKTLDVHLSRLRRKLPSVALELRSIPPNRVALVARSS